MPVNEVSTTTRRRGRPPRINLNMVLSVSRSISPDQLTIQVVADRLGVQRNAINYLVGDKEGLLRLLAEDALLHRPAPDTHGASTWCDLLHEYGVWLRDTYLTMSDLPDYVPCDTIIDPQELDFVQNIERVLNEADFPQSMCRRVILGVAALTAGFVHSVRLAARAVPLNGLRHAVSDDGRVPLSPEQAGSALPDLDSEQFEFMLDSYIDGLERHRRVISHVSPLPAL